MKISAGILLVIILACSCAHKTKVSQYLPQSKLTDVMWDLVRADQYVADYMKDSVQKKKMDSWKLYEEIFQVHKVSEKQFKESLAYYSSHPDLFGPILDSLAKRRTPYVPYLPHMGMRQKKDSLNRARLPMQKPVLK